MNSCKKENDKKRLCRRNKLLERNTEKSFPFATGNTPYYSFESTADMTVYVVPWKLHFNMFYHEVNVVL